MTNMVERENFGCTTMKYDKSNNISKEQLLSKGQYAALQRITFATASKPTSTLATLTHLEPDDTLIWISYLLAHPMPKPAKSLAHSVSQGPQGRLIFAFTTRASSTVQVRCRAYTRGVQPARTSSPALIFWDSALSHASEWWVQFFEGLGANSPAIPQTKDSFTVLPWKAADLCTAIRH